MGSTAGYCVSCIFVGFVLNIVTRQLLSSATPLPAPQLPPQAILYVNYIPQERLNTFRGGVSELEVAAPNLTEASHPELTAGNPDFQIISSQIQQPVASVQPQIPSQVVQQMQSFHLLQIEQPQMQIFQTQHPQSVDSSQVQTPGQAQLPIPSQNPQYQFSHLLSSSSPHFGSHPIHIAQTPLDLQQSQRPHYQHSQILSPSFASPPMYQFSSILGMCTNCNPSGIHTVYGLPTF